MRSWRFKVTVLSELPTSISLSLSRCHSHYTVEPIYHYIWSSELPGRSVSQVANTLPSHFIGHNRTLFSCSFCNQRPTCMNDHFYERSVYHCSGQAITHVRGIDAETLTRELLLVMCCVASVIAMMARDNGTRNLTFGAQFWIWEYSFVQRA
jgi:hypothetical protein